MSSVDLYSFITGNSENAEHFEQFLRQVGLLNFYEFVCLVKEIFESESSQWGPAIRTLNKNYVDSLPLSDPVRLTIKSKIAKEDYTKNIFDEAVKEVWDFLSKEVYKEFIFYLQISHKSPTPFSHPFPLDDPGSGQSSKVSHVQNVPSSSSTCPAQPTPTPSCSGQEKLREDSTKRKKEKRNRVERGQDCEQNQQSQSSGGHSDHDLHHDTSPVTGGGEEGTVGESFEGSVVNPFDNFQEAPRWPSGRKLDDINCFARKLIKKLEHVKQQRDYMNFLTRKLKEQAGDKLSSDDDEILNQHVKNVWTDDSPPPPAKREYKTKDCHPHPHHSKNSLPKSRTFPTPSTSKCDPDSGISVVSGSTWSSAASTSRSALTEEFSEGSTTSGHCGGSSRGRHGGSERSKDQVKSRKWWKKMKEIPVVVQYHGNSVPLSFAIPTATEKITLRVFKKYLPHKGNFRYLFQYSGSQGQGIEEIFEDTSEIPTLHGKIVATIKPFY